MDKEYIEVLPFGIDFDFRERMSQLLFAAKLSDGQKGEINLGEIRKRIFKNRKIQKEITKRLISKLESLKVNPKYLRKIIPEIIQDNYYSFAILESEPRYLTIQGFVGGESLTGIVNSDNYFEEEYIFKLIKRWYSINKKTFPQDFNINNYYFDDGFEIQVLSNQKGKLLRGEIDQIDSLEFFNIYHYQASELKKKKVRRLKKRILKKYIFWEREISELLELEHFSDRGSIIVDRSSLYKINNKFVYEFYSRDFFYFLSLWFELHDINPDAFDKGAHFLLANFFSFVKGKHPNSDIYYLRSFEAFILKLTQTYAYFGNKEKGLRIDLFRNIVPEKNIQPNKTFEGGLFHVFRHFKRNNLPFSSSYEGGPEIKLDPLLDTLREAFFVGDIEVDRRYKNKLNSTVVYNVDKSKKIKVTFFKHPIVENLFFIDSLHFAR